MSKRKESSSAQDRADQSGTASSSQAEERGPGESFEARLERLEQLSEKIRQGDVSLDDAVKQFEEGIKLAKSLEHDLSRVERKVEILINEPEEGTDETPALELFPELSELNAGKNSGHGSE